MLASLERVVGVQLNDHPPMLTIYRNERAARRDSTTTSSLAQRTRAVRTWNFDGGSHYLRSSETLTS